MSRPLEGFSIRLESTILQAMQALDRGAAEIALVTDDAHCLLGVMTDGDVRRALLSGASLASPLEPYLQRHFVAVAPQASRAEVIDLMRARKIGQVPIVDADGKLVGLHLLHEIVGAIERPNAAVIMAGGRGERLRPLTDTIPKPMIKVAGRPILERIVLHLVGFGVRHIHLSVNYLCHVIEEHFGDGKAFGCCIEYLHEDKPLGTGGALSLLPEVPPCPLIVMNGDLLTQFDVADLLSFHEAGGYRATVGVHAYTHTVPYGVVEVQGERITHFREKPSMAWLTNAGIYALEPGLLARIPRDTAFSLPELIESCVAQNEPVGAFRVDADWLDIGQPPELQRARGETGEPSTR